MPAPQQLRQAGDDSGTKVYLGSLSSGMTFFTATVGAGICHAESAIRPAATRPATTTNTIPIRFIFAPPFRLGPDLATGFRIAMPPEPDKIRYMLS
uniref:Uncharacterized protein n=1 Tax=uncultured alpha proteobacterium HF0070_17D04 TaxID=710805 RepID=E0XS75_9PROT|nr:hypothetical protein [uncultured alpha proteobacterium HF0070_17D04]